MPTHPPDSIRLAYTVDEVLDLVPIGKTKLKQLLATGQVRTTRVGRRVLIPRDAVIELAERGAQ